MKNIRIWLTGAGKGIGEAIAERLSKEGCKLVITSKSIDSLKKISAKYAGDKNIYLFQCDVKQSEQIENVYGKIKSSLGGVDVLINNAGIGIFAELTELTEKDFDDMVGVNLKGAFLAARAVLPEMLVQKNGIIININSVSALSNFKDCSIYSATKAGLLAMSRSLREEVRKIGIKVIDILPGATLTDIWDEGSKKEFGDKMMLPEDVAEAVFHIISLNQNPRLMTEEVIIRPQWGDL